jgi:branched-chain amino acid transport system ATP-binding protein
VVLELRGVTHRYGTIAAVDDVSLTVQDGGRHALIGPNGAGKSTLFAMIAGSVKVDSGSILLNGQDMTSWPDHRRARHGLGRSYQTGSLFEEFTALENVALAVQHAGSAGARQERGRRAVLDRSRHFLEMAGLITQEGRIAAELSHGERRQLEVAMALATNATTILLDEPSAGMSPSESERFVELIHSLPVELTMLLIEHDLDVVFSVASQISVLNLGTLIFTGTPAEARSSEAVQVAYLGVGTGTAEESK